ncbi:MAG: 5'-3' exonuclease H3TH domain-containing protein [Acidihalobacter sp.]|uniref:5'-3' exonuclease n=1 Tax=Acidihalobacter sp. TaxID=1872108 RepID=UPI00307D49B3
MSPPILLVDSSIYVFRAWFTLPGNLLDAQGRPANAVLGFLDFAQRLFAERAPSRIAFAFDQSVSSNFRNDIYPDYKANRPPAPDELRQQFAQVRVFLRAAGLCELSSPRFEADDLIGTLAARERAKGERLLLITADKDLAQLIGADDHWWDFPRGEPLDPRAVARKFGVRPDQIADQLALAGDKVDNIPGVPGVGMATAAKLLHRFGSLEALLTDIPAIGQMKIRGAKRLMLLIDEHQDTVRLARRLTGIECAAELPEHGPLERRPPDPDALQAWFELMGLSERRRDNWLALLSGEAAGTPS